MWCCKNYLFIFPRQRVCRSDEDFFSMSVCAAEVCFFYDVQLNIFINERNGITCNSNGVGLKDGRDDMTTTIGVRREG